MTLALIGWLLCIAFIIVGATVLAAEFDRAQGRRAVRLKERFAQGRRVGGHAPDRDSPPSGGELEPEGLRSLTPGSEQWGVAHGPGRR